MAPLDPTSLAEVLIIALSLVALCSPPRNPDGRAALVFLASEVPRDSVVSRWRLYRKLRKPVALRLLGQLARRGRQACAAGHTGRRATARCAGPRPATWDP